MYIKNIVVENIKCFGKGKRAVDIDFQRPDGSYAGITVLAGRNGSGKSTLLRAIALSAAGIQMGPVLQVSYNDWVTRGEKEGWVSTGLIFDKEDKFQNADNEKRPGKNSFTTGLLWKSTGVNSEPVMSSMFVPNKDEKFFFDSIMKGPWSPNPEGWFIAGYGPFRHLPANGIDAFKGKNTKPPWLF